MEHTVLYCAGLGTFNYMLISPRVALTERQRTALWADSRFDSLPMRIPARISFDLTTYEAAQLFGGGN